MELFFSFLPSFFFYCIQFCLHDCSHTEEEKSPTYHNGLGHHRFEGIAEVDHPLFIVSEYNVFLVSFQQLGLAHCGLIEADRRDEVKYTVTQSPFGACSVTLRYHLYVTSQRTFPLSSIFLRDFWLAWYLFCSRSSSPPKIQYFPCELL